MRLRQAPSLRPAESGGKRRLAAEPSQPSRQHPLIALQRRLGNRAVARLLQRQPARSESGGENLSVEEHAAQYVRREIASEDRSITEWFGYLEASFLPPNRESRISMVRLIKNHYKITGLLTLTMLDTLHEAVLPGKDGDKNNRAYIEQIFEKLRKHVRQRDDWFEVLERDDLAEWYLDRLKRLAGR